MTDPKAPSTVPATRPRSSSSVKRFMRRTRSISKSISNPTKSRVYSKAREKLDANQLALIKSMTRHGLLLLISSAACCACTLYIVFSFDHYERVHESVHESDEAMMMYFYLLWLMGVTSFLNALSLYLSFTFSTWMYTMCCNRVHIWMEALCVIIIGKRLRKKSRKNRKQKETEAQTKTPDFV